jgi:hypothetical protein
MSSRIAAPHVLFDLDLAETDPPEYAREEVERAIHRGRMSRTFKKAFERKGGG